MTIKEFKEILNNLPDDAIMLVSGGDVETIYVEYHSDGRSHVIFSSDE